MLKSVKSMCAEKLNIPVKNLVVLRIGGWLNDEFNPCFLPDKDKIDPIEFDPSFPNDIKQYYVCLSVLSGTQLGQEFQIEFTKSEVEEYNKQIKGRKTRKPSSQTKRTEEERAVT